MEASLRLIPGTNTLEVVGAEVQHFLRSTLRRLYPAVCDGYQPQLQLAIKFPGGTGFWSRWVTSLTADKSNVRVITERTGTVLHPLLSLLLPYKERINGPAPFEQKHLCASFIY